MFMTKERATQVANMVEMPSGILVPYDFAEQKAIAERRETGVDVFAGCGGSSLGFIKAGFNVVAAIEWAVEAVVTYMCNLCRWGQVQMYFIEETDRAKMEKALAREFKANRKGRFQLELPLAGTGAIACHEEWPGVANVIVGDVRKLSGTQLLEIIDMKKGELGCMFGGPPCQGFSFANGRRCPEDVRNSLVFEFARLIVETMPKTMVMENVPGILTMTTPDGTPVVARFCQILKDGGFHGVEAFEKALERHGAAGAMNQKPAKRRKKGKSVEDEDAVEEDKPAANPP